MYFIIITLSGIAAIFVCIRLLKRPLYQAVYIGVIVIALVAGLSPGEFLKHTWAALSRYGSWNTVFVTIFATFFGTLLLHTGHIAAIFSRFMHRLKPGGLMMFVAIAMGVLLSPPGGSKVSSQMLVNIFPPQTEAETVALTLDNIWFRVCGRLISPFIPTLAIIYNTLEINLGWILLAAFPMAVALTLIGVAFFIRRYRKITAYVPEEPVSVSYPCSGLLPLLLVLTLTVCGLPLYVCLIIGSALALWEQRRYHGESSRWRYLLLMLDWRLCLAVIGVNIYNQIMSGSNTLPQFIDLAAGLISSDLVLVTVIAIIGLLLGYCMGSLVGAIGVAIPIVQAMGGGHVLLLIALVYVTANIGCYMLSPLNTDYLSAQDILSCQFSQIYKRILWPLLCALAAAVCYGYIAIKFF